MKRHGPEDPPDDMPLFSMPPHNQRPTSIAAAWAKHLKSGTQRRKVFDAIIARGAAGATREELADFLGLSSKAVDPRVWELLGNPVKDERPPLIGYASFYRKTKSGMEAEVLVGL